jgi:hypothetical protein
MKKDLSMINWDWKDFRNLLDKLRKHTALPISIEEINSKIVSGKELTVNDDYVSIADLAVNLYEYNESKNRSIGKVEYSLEFVSKLFNYNTGFTCMEIRYESFYVKPSWSPLESKIYGLDKSIFVLMTNYTVETDKIDYLISKADRIDAVFIMKDDQQPFDAQKKAELLTRLSETNMAVLFFDIDEFKEKVNNKYPRRVIAQLIQNKRVKACISTTIML